MEHSYSEEKQRKQETEKRKKLAEIRKRLQEIDPYTDPETTQGEIDELIAFINSWDADDEEADRLDKGED